MSTPKNTCLKQQQIWNKKNFSEYITKYTIFPVFPKEKANINKYKSIDFTEEVSLPTYLDIFQKSEMKKEMGSKNVYRFKAVEYSNEIKMIYIFCIRWMNVVLKLTKACGFFSHSTLSVGPGKYLCSITMLNYHV